MRARSGCASALAMRASEVSPAGRVRLPPEEDCVLVGMVVRKNIGHLRDTSFREFESERLRANSLAICGLCTSDFSRAARFRQAPVGTP
jgi:hypothetical protein